MSNRYFRYRDGRLHASGVPLDALAAEVGTPFYCYDADALEHGYRHFAAAIADLPATICYALMANSNQAVIATFAALGAGADVVSEGEMRSEEHPSELQSLMRTSYAVFCLKKLQLKNKKK